MTFPESMVVVIPAFNEAGRLDRGAFDTYITADPARQLLFVNDGSTDDTGAMLNAMAAAHPAQVRVLHLAQNGGKGEAVRQGLLAAHDAGCQLAVFLDADLAAPLSTADLLADDLRGNPSLVLAIGSRVKLLGWAIERSERRHYLGRVFATFASLALALPIYDTQCGAKALRCAALPVLLAEPFSSRWLFDVELIARVRDRFGATAMREIPLPEWRDPGGSKVRLRDFITAPLALWRIRRMYPPSRSTPPRAGPVPASRP